MSRLIDIALELKPLYEAVETRKTYLSHLAEDADGRKVAVTPPGGWEGKNPEERKAKAEHTCAADSVLMKISEAMRTLQEQMAGLSSHIQALEAERRALEWTIRADMVEVLRGKPGYQNDNQHVQDSEFDGVGDTVITNEITIAGQDAAMIETDDIPF